MLVNSSLAEGESNAILEAMATGTLPVVARHNDGNAALVDDGKTGLLFDSPEQGVVCCKALVGLHPEQQQRRRCGAEDAAQYGPWEARRVLS